MTKQQLSQGSPWAASLVLLAVLACLPANTALDVCLTRPWQIEASLARQTPTVVSISSFEELQDHINAAEGPATFVLEAMRLPLVASQPVHINKSSITIAASRDWLQYSDSRSSTARPAQLPVMCADTAGSLLHLDHVLGVRVMGLHISGCSSSAIKFNNAVKTVLRGCLFNSNSNSSSGGAVDALRSQVWVDSCTFQANAAAGGSGGAISASFSHMLVTDSRFVANSAGVSGGAVAMRGRSTDASAAAAAAAAAGQGACWRDTDAVLNGVTFEGNRAKLQGGALAANGSHVVMQAVTANNNKARYGGVSYLGQTAQLTVKGGSSMANNTAASSGGVVYAVSPGARVVLASSTFTGNQAKILGGVVSAKEAASVRLDDCRFSNNTADLAAGVVYARDADMTANSCSFTSNSAKRDGGALYCAGGCIWKLRSCTFRGNECGANGGAIFGWNVEASISSSSMDENSAGALGGGVAVANSTLELKSCKLGTNNAYGSDAAGGGVYSQGSSLNLTDCFLAGNVASWGGAVYVTNSTLTLTGGGIANSSATGSGAAMYVLRSSVTVANTTLSYNDAQLYGGSMYCSDSACSLVGCDILGDSAAQGGGCFWVGRGSLSLRRSHIAGCVSATDDGGAVHAAAATSVTVVGCSIKGCSALKGSGGALWLSGVQTVSIRGSLFAQNQAMYGGSLYISNSTATLSSSSVINSTATVGGGIAATVGSELVLLNNTAVAGNAAAVGGGIAADSTHVTLTGPVAVSWNKALRPTLTSTAVTTPAAAASAAADAATAAAATAVSPSAVFGGQAVLRGLGGGMYAHNCRVLGSDVRLERNTADRVGAGAYLDRCGAKLVSSNISRNQATEEAGGLKLLNPAQGSALLHCTVANNWAGLKGGGLAMVGVDLASEVALVDVQLLNNSASGQAGGGLWLNGPLGLLMVGGEVSGNTAGTSAVAAAAAAADSAASSEASLQAAGGGMLLEDCSWAALHGVDILGNAALAGCGGGLALSGCGKILLDSSTVLGNVAGSGGGLCAFDLLSFMTLHNSTVSSNRVLLGGLWESGAAAAAMLSPTPEPHLHCGVKGTGGGLCISSLGEVLINSSTITRNQARNGGAMALGLCGNGDKCSLGLVDATFINNTAVQGGGGAVYFSTAVSPYQVRCGEDYNVSSITGYARGTSFPSLASLLESAAFIHSSSGNGTGAAGSSTLPPGSGSSSSSTDAASTDTSSSGSAGSSSGSLGINEGIDTLSPTPPSSSPSSEDDILASTPGSHGAAGGSSSSSSAAPVAGTDTADDAGGSTASPGVADASTETFLSDNNPATTTVSFGNAEEHAGGPQALAVGPAAAAVPGLLHSSMPASPAASAALLTSAGSAAAAQAESAKASDDIIAATDAFDPTAQLITGSISPAGAAAGGAADDDVDASTSGFIPPSTAAAKVDPALFTIASVPEVHPSMKVPANSSQAAYQARSAKIAAGLQPQSQHQHQHRPQQHGSNSTSRGGQRSQQQSAAAVAAAAAAGQGRHKGHTRAAEAQLPGTDLPEAATDATALAAVAGASAADRANENNGQAATDDGKLDWELADASEGLRVIDRPQDRSSTTAAASASKGAEADALLAAAQTTAGANRVAGSSSSTASKPAVPLAGREAQKHQQQHHHQPQQQQQHVAGARVPLTEAAARTLAVPVTLPVLQAAEKAGVHPKVTTAWQRIGTVSLGTLMDAGVVDPALLRDYWAAYPKSEGASAQGAAGAAATGWQHQFYARLAVVLSQAAALQADRTAATTSSGLSATRHGNARKPYAACDTVQNPAACPVPKPPRAHEYPDPGLQAAAAAAARAPVPAAAAAEADVPSSVSQEHGAGSLNGRRLAQVDAIITAAEEAAGNMTFMSTDVTSVGAAAPPSASSNSFILQGASQCGFFSHNAAIGARAYGPVVTSRPAGLRVWGSTTANDTSSILVATGGQLQVLVSVVDVFGGIVTSGAADFIRIRATLTPPMGLAAAAGSKGASDLMAAASLSAADMVTRGDPNREVDDSGVELSGLQQLSTSNGSLILSGLQLSGLPGTNTTLFITASDPSLLPASLPITLTSCSAGYMQLPGQCQLCPVNTFSFTADEPLCSLCPVGASCNGTTLVPLAGYWHSTPRSAQVHTCLNPAACARDAPLQQQQLLDWQATHYGRGAVVGKSKESLAHELEQYMSDQCAPGYSGRMCGVCTQEPAAIAANSVSHGMVGGACVACGKRETVIGTFVLVRLFDLGLWAVLTFLACKAANAWAQALALNPATAAATAGSLPPVSAAASSTRGGNKSTSRGGELILASTAAATAAAAEVPVVAALHAHVSIFFDYLQMLSVISASAASYAWPKVLKTFMAAFAFVPLGTSRWVSAECLLPYVLSYRHSIVGLLLTAALPLLYLMSSAAVWIAGLIMGRTHRTAIMALVVGTGLFYPLITMSALSVFSCHTLDDSKAALPGEQLSAVGSYWTLDPELKCYQGQHLQLTLGFGLPVVLLVVFAWPLLLASMLWDSRFRIRDQQLHPATRRRYLVRKTIKMCHQILGVMCGYHRPLFYLWPVVVEVRKLLLCVVVVLVAGSPAPVQLYVLWSLLAVLLVLEWWLRPGLTWPVVGLQLVGLGAMQGVVYLASAFTQVSLVGSAATFSALIIVLCCMVAVAFILSIIAAFRANKWLLKVLDVDKDGKVSGKDLLESASKLFHLGIQHVPGKDDPGSPDGKSGTAASTSTASSKGSVWKGAVLFFSKRRMAGAQADAAAAQDAAATDDRSAHDQARPGSPGAAAAGSASPGAGRISPLLGRSPRLVANSLPITNAAAAAAAASATGSPGAGPPGDGGVPTSSSIDMGMLAMLRQMNGAGSFNGTAAMPAAGSSLDHSGGRQQPQHFVAVDLGQFSNSAALQQERRQQQQQQQPGQQQQGHPATMGRANSTGALGASGGRMPLHTYMSVQQWLEQSIDLVHGPRHPDMAASGSLDQSSHQSGLSPGSRVNSTGRSRSLQLSASTPAPQVAALRSSSGSLALQRAQLVQQFQQQHYADRDSCGGHVSGNIAEGAADLSTLRSVSETEPHLSTPQRQRQQRRRLTGPAAAARAREIAAAAAAPSEGDAGVQVLQGTAPAARHQPYYALWSNIASAITGPTGSADSTATGGRPPAAASGYNTSSKASERQQSSQSSSRRGVAGISSSITRSSAGTRGMPSSGFATGSIGSSSNSSRPRQSPFAAAAVAAAATGPSQPNGAGMRPSPFAAAAAALGQGGAVGSSVPAARAASAPDCHAATAALAAAAAGAPSVSKGRHSSYYSMWQAAMGEVSSDASAAAAAAALQQPQQQQQSGPGMTAQPAATAPPVVLEPGRHKQYIGLWSALAEELGDGPSAVGAATPGPVVPSEIAAAFAAAMASSSNVGSVSAATAAAAPQTSAQASSSSSSSHVPQHQPGRVRPSPFATMNAAVAVIGEDVVVGEAAGGNVQQQQREQQRQRHRRRPGRRPRDSAGTCLGSDSD